MNVSLHALVLTVVFALSSGGTHAGLWRDGHQRLPDGLLPALGHLQAHAGRGECGVVDVQVRSHCVLPHVVDHGGRDDLEAVGVPSQGQVAEILGRFYLEDLRQGDLLRVNSRDGSVSLIPPHQLRLEDESIANLVREGAARMRGQH